MVNLNCIVLLTYDDPPRSLALCKDGVHYLFSESSIYVRQDNTCLSSHFNAYVSIVSQTTLVKW